MKALYEFKGPVVLLSLLCRLPLEEEGYLETYCWPMRYVNDKLDYVVPFKMWDQIASRLINNTGIILKEKM